MVSQVTEKAVADRPHTYTLGFSLCVAVTSVISAALSGYSLYIAEQNRHIAEQTARAIVQLTNVTLSKMLKPKQAGIGKSGIAVISLTLKNLGKAMASDIRAQTVPL